MSVQPEDIEIPKSLHYRLHKMAEEEGVSMETLLIAMLAEGAAKAERDVIRKPSFAPAYAAWSFRAWQPSPSLP